MPETWNRSLYSWKPPSFIFDKSRDLDIWGVFQKRTNKLWWENGDRNCWKLPCGIYKKVNCTLVQALRLCTGRTAHRGSRGIALPFLDHGTTRGWGVSVTPRPLFTPGKDPVPIVQVTGWVPGPVWKGAENLASHRDSIPGPSSP
jgi:hypothetical protein